MQLYRPICRRLQCCRERHSSRPGDTQAGWDCFVFVPEYAPTAINKPDTMPAFNILRPQLPAARHTVQWRPLPDSQLSLALVQAARQASGPVLVITNSSEEAEQLRRELQFFSAGNAQQELPVYTFPDW